MTTTRLSSKGQIVIPEAIRRRLGLDPGSEFVVLGDGDTIVLQRVRAPTMQDFDTIVARARQAARRAGMRRSDVAAAIDAVRST
ncbi:MAG: AbrB/MazE/SpoVT family DNA-binding domain-containing protein [Acidobacteria bacterium]|nr:AbrB/MazE/SpoVT family DNA-binding domain-containing protein [Acidobacteriota bacterium]